MKKEQTSHKNEHNTLMCFSLEPVFTRDKRRLPNFIDEPASGLDPRARFEMKGILKNLHEIDKTIIISSHILSELAEMCTTIGIIDHGQMMVKGTVDEIMTRLNTSNPLQIRIVEGMDQAVKILKENPTVVNLSVDANMLLVGFKGNEEEEAALLASLI